MSTVGPTSRPATEVRAYHVRDVLRILAEGDREREARIRARLGAEALATLETAHRLAWIPGLIDVALWRAIHDETGDDGVRRTARTVGVRHVQTGHLSGLLQGVVQLFGLTPAGIVRWIPRGFAEVHRGVGELRIAEVHEGLARLVLEDLHPSLAGEPWLLAVAGSFELALEVSGHDGEAALESAGPERAVISLRWRQRAARP